MSLNHFRPKARHIFTIWKDLIKDDFTALVELVKNAYDADATKVDIKFEKTSNGRFLLTVVDDWNGMSESDIRSKWLVPSTDNKLKARFSDRLKRPLQWQKGIWRYAASVLWDELVLETVNDRKKTVLRIDWNDFNAEDKYLDEIPLYIESQSSNEPPGTKISIFGSSEKIDTWNIRQLTRLKRELSQLISPYDDVDGFDIYLDVSEFIKTEPDTTEFSETKIQFLKQEGFFDYKISGDFVKDDKTGSRLLKLNYQNADTKESLDFCIPAELNDCFFSDEIKKTFPGEFSFEFLVIDRDPIREREEVSRAMWNSRERTSGRKIFDLHYWVKLYRGGFRIRPYGESGDDWLNLDSRRVNSPSFRISNNQVIGIIRIWTEELSGLRELTSRGGLIENEFYWGLKCIIWKILNELEVKKQVYRVKVWLGRHVNKKLNYNELKDDLLRIANKFDHPRKEDFAKELSTWIDKAFSQVQEREKFLEKVLFIYERQATLGKVIAELIHEIKQPLHFFKWKVRKIEFLLDWINKLLGRNDEKALLSELLEIANSYKENSLRVLRFFKNIEPLASNNRKYEFSPLLGIIQSSIEPNKERLENWQVEIVTDVEDVSVFGDRIDFIIAISNFIDNSIYWLSLQDPSVEKRIFIKSVVEGGDIHVFFSDNGVGLVKRDLKDDIFEPWITLKEKGSGLWLSIAGEVLKRNDVSLSLIDSEVWFTLRLSFSKWKR